MISGDAMVLRIRSKPVSVERKVAVIRTFSAHVAMIRTNSVLCVSIINTRQNPSMKYTKLHSEYII